MANIGERFVSVTNKLNDMGVFYGNNYDGKYHDKYPHSGYWFQLELDNHRGGFEANIMHDGEIYKRTAVVYGRNTPLMIVELLEKSYEFLVNELKN